MFKLMKANMSRLFKSRIFLIAEILAVGFPIFLILVSYFENKERFGSDFKQEIIKEHIMDSSILNMGVFMPIVLAVVIGLFIGTEYRDGTIRNKIIVGHNRSKMYFSNLITSFVANIIIFSTTIVTICAVGIPLLSKPTIPFIEYVKTYAVLVLGGCACCAIYMAVSMTVQSKSTGVVIVMITAFTMFFTTINIKEKLTQPEYFEPYSYEENGETVTVPAEKNSDYLTGTKRKIYETIYKLIPYSQMMELSSKVGLPEKPYEYPLFSCGWLVISTAVGTLVFKKRNLK